jgi:hypothetical protein
VWAWWGPSNNLELFDAVSKQFLSSNSVRFLEALVFGVFMDTLNATGTCVDSYPRGLLPCEMCQSRRMQLSGCKAKVQQSVTGIGEQVIVGIECVQNVVDNFYWQTLKRLRHGNRVAV